MLYNIHTTRILYAIENEDLDYCETEQDFIEEQARIVSELPQELDLEIDCDCKEDLEDLICDEITETTGWLIRGFEYEIVEL